MDPRIVTALLWAAGIVMAMLVALVALAYRNLKQETERNAKNIHDLRGQMSPVALWVEVLKERVEMVKLFREMLDAFKEALRKRD